MNNDKISVTMREISGDFSEVKEIFKRGNVYIVLFPDDSSFKDNGRIQIAEKIRISDK